MGDGGLAIDGDADSVVSDEAFERTIVGDGDVFSDVGSDGVGVDNDTVGISSGCVGAGGGGIGVDSDGVVVDGEGVSGTRTVGSGCGFMTAGDGCI